MRYKSCQQRVPETWNPRLDLSAWNLAGVGGIRLSEIRNYDTERVMADHGVKWPLESLVNESANDFVKRLESEGRKIFKDYLISSGVDDDQSLEKALEKITSFNCPK